MGRRGEAKGGGGEKEGEREGRGSFWRGEGEAERRSPLRSMPVPYGALSPFCQRHDAARPGVRMPRDGQAMP